jgi:DNA-binding TFAR19-related protein (PDSD5 family)
MKIRTVAANNRKNEFSLITRSGQEYSFPYSKAEPKPSADDPVERVFVDKELGNEAFTYALRSGEEGSVHIEQVLEYHEDPEYLADLLTYKLSIEAQKRVDRSELSRRQLAKQLNTSVPQLYRLLDPANTNKSMKQLITLLHVLDCDVDVILKKRQPNKSLQRTVVSVTHFAKSKMRATAARR